jgi:hypothetical protein
MSLEGLAGGPAELRFNSGQEGSYTVDGAGNGQLDPASIATDTEYTFRGEGSANAGLGAFSGTLTVPPALVLLEPELTPGLFGSAATIDLSSDVTVRWQGSSSGYMHVSLQGRESGVECLTDDDGELTIPAAELASITPGPVAFVNILKLERRSYGTASGPGLGTAKVEAVLSIIANWQAP